MQKFFQITIASKLALLRVVMSILITVILVIGLCPQEVAAALAYKKVVVIDAGHGGWDPGKVGESHTPEAEINLAIAKELQALLELGGAIVFLTRAEDLALADTKNADLIARAAMPKDMFADIFISIHQNAYHDKGVHGAQVFYYEDSAESQKLAEAVQEGMRNFLDKDNKKEAKGNDNYFLLRKTQTPAIIVECGFLTNEDEGARLTKPDYQRKVAWGVYLGLLEYFEVS